VRDSSFVYENHVLMGPCSLRPDSKDGRATKRRKLAQDAVSQATFADVLQRMQQENGDARGSWSPASGVRHDGLSRLTPIPFIQELKVVLINGLDPL
jgi:hypothetical protein